MERSLTLFLLIFSSAFLLAQTYTPVVINGEVFFSTQLETAAGIVPAEVTVANFEKIDGQLYNRVFFKRNLEADMLVGYLREDPAAGEIYFRTTANAEEFLVYDISLEVGESIALQARWCDGLAGDVATVVSVTTTAGRRELVFDRTVGEDEICETLTFIEGVGPSASLIFPIFRTAIAENGVAQRLCHASHEAVIYYPSGTNTDFCGGAITSTEEVAYGRKIELFPTPVHDVLQLRGLPADSEVSVYTATGQLLLKRQLNDQLNVAQWPAGLYVLIFRLPDGERVVEKIIKG